MTDRVITYAGSIPLETDILRSNKFAMMGIAKLAAAMLGTSTIVNGLACVPTTPASLTVNVNPGEIYSLVNVDSNAYSSIPADTTHQIVKQGIQLDIVTPGCPAPGTAGFSINYLIQVAYQDTDTDLTALPYYNASNPTQAWSGPNNSGTAQATTRKGVVTLSAKAGVAATTGSQTTPAPDAGYTGLWVVTVANGQTQITSANITQAANAPILPTDLLHAIQASSLITAADTGSANTYVVSFSPAITALTDGMVVWFKAKTANTGASTLNVNGIGASPMVGGAHSALQGGEIVANGKACAVWRADISSWVLIDCTGGALQVSPATQSNHAIQLGQATGRIAGTPRVFTSSGTYTPSAGVNSVIVEVIGAGGGGGGTTATGAGQISVGSGGGAGGYAISRLTSGFSGVSMTIGAGGASGSNGGTTSFGALLSATGGGAGAVGPAAAAGYVTINGYGGVGSGGNVLNSRGGDGSPGLGVSASSFSSGAGGVSRIGAGGGGLPTQSSGGSNALTAGSGGGGGLAGASTAAQTGGTGAAGMIIVWEYF
jgi:hypothetical protein